MYETFDFVVGTGDLLAWYLDQVPFLPFAASSAAAPRSTLRPSTLPSLLQSLTHQIPNSLTYDKLAFTWRTGGPSQSSCRALKFPISFAHNKFSPPLVALTPLRPFYPALTSSPNFERFKKPSAASVAVLLQILACRWQASRGDSGLQSRAKWQFLSHLENLAQLCVTRCVTQNPNSVTQ